MAWGFRALYICQETVPIQHQLLSILVWLQAQLQTNATVRSDAELCHDISKESSAPSFDSVVSR